MVFSCEIKDFTPSVPVLRPIILRYRSISTKKPLKNQRLIRFRHLDYGQMKEQNENYQKFDSVSSKKSIRDFKPTICLPATVHTEPKFIALISRFGADVFAVYMTCLNSLRIAEGEPLGADDILGLAALCKIEVERFEDVLLALIEYGYLEGKLTEGVTSSLVTEDLERLNRKRAAGRLGRLKQLENQNGDHITTTQGTPGVPQGYPQGKPEIEIELEIERSLKKNGQPSELPPLPHPDDIKTAPPRFPKLLFSKAEREKAKKYYESHDLDESDLEFALETLQAYAENSPKKFAKYKSHYKVLTGWVFDNVLERRRRMLDLARSEAYAAKAGGVR